MRVIGTVVEEESGKPLQGLRVRAYDKDLNFDDKLGDTLTDAAGKFEISYTEARLVLAAVGKTGKQPLEEIIVTATKRGGQLVQDVPITIQAIGGERLLEAGALDFNDYYRQVPGLSLNDQGPGDKRYITRGINSSGSGTVGLYFDETIVTGENLNMEGGRQPDIRLFDLDRIEVLKGPQGTTFGSSSLSGTIRWIPNYPDLSEFAADVGGTLSSTEHADGLSWNVDGMVNIPLAPGRVALRHLP